MKKALIVCWFGTLPNYFKLWEYSCSLNQDYDFLIFSDQFIESDFKNVKVFKVEINQIKRLIKEKLNININLKRPYKLCDIRPAYGVIFEEYLKEYDYWGHCDLDQVFGNISDFLSDDVISKYEKINHNGHFALYKNNKRMNNMFKNSGSKFDWKEVFSRSENYAFDEYSGINMICKNNQVKEYSNNNFADIDKKYNRYRTVNHKNCKKQIFVFFEGKIFRYVLKKNKIERIEEFFYLHFQKKVPIIEEKIDFEKMVVMGSKKFGNEKRINENIFEEYNSSKNKIAEFIELGEYYVKKVFEFIKDSKSVKLIKIKQKIIR